MDFSIFIESYNLDQYLCCAACRVRLFVTVWTAGGQAARFFSPWDFSIKYTGVRCHFLLHYLFQNIFITPRETPSPHSLLSASPWQQPPTAFCPYGFSCLISMDSLCGHNVWPFFAEHHVCKVHPCCNLHPYLIHFYGWIVQIYNILFTHLPGDGYLDFSGFLTIVTGASVNIPRHIFV